MEGIWWDGVMGINVYWYGILVIFLSLKCMGICKYISNKNFCKNFL